MFWLSDRPTFGFAVIVGVTAGTFGSNANGSVVVGCDGVPWTVSSQAVIAQSVVFGPVGETKAVRSRRTK